MKRLRKARKAAALLLALGLVLLLPLSAAARVPDRPGNKYVLDEANVLSDATEREIVDRSSALFADSGGEIVVVAVDFLGGQEIDDYAYDLFNSWGIGSEERNNGLLLVLAIGEDDYYAVPGYGIENEFSGSVLKNMLNEYLEPDFAAGDYDAGVQKFFRAALDKMNSLEYNDGYDTDYHESYEDYSYEDNDFYFQGRLGFFRVVLRLLARLVLIFVVVVVIVVVINAFSRGNGSGGPGGTGGGGFWRGMFIGNILGGSRRRRWYGAPPPPPPPGGFGPGPRPPRNGGFGGFGGFGGGSRGGFSGGGHSGSFGGSRGGFSGGGRSGGSRGGFSGGGGSRGGGAGRR